MRTRTAAADLVKAGYVRVNGERVRAASHLLRRGDVLTLAHGPSVRLWRVLGFAERRGSAGDAQPLYEAIDADPPAVDAGSRGDEP